jgi:hypothetical protein
LTGYALTVTVGGMATTTSPLRVWLDTQPLGSITGLARKLGKPYRSLARWVSGERTPCLHDALAISDATGKAVRIEDWPDLRPKKRRRKSAKHRPRQAVAS